MKTRHFWFAAIPLIAGCLLLGCGDEPTNVGIGLIDVQAGEPELVTLHASAFVSGETPDITGGPVFTDAESGAARVLAGNVSDPALGTITAVGYVDFVQSTPLSDDFKNGTISSVELLLETDYVYGDTLTPVTLRLFDMNNDWTSIASRADVVLIAGSAITEFTFVPVPGTVSVDLPSSWVSDNNALFRRDDVGELFHGFQIQFVEGNAVAGFSNIQSRMRVAVPGDTVDFQVTEVVSNISKDPLPGPAEFILLQDGTDATVELSFELTGDDLANNAVHRSVIRVNSSTPDLVTPPGFFRPSLTSVRLIAITGDDDHRVPIGDGLWGIGGLISFENESLNNAVQNIVKDIADWRRFEITAAVSLNSLDVLFLHRSGESAPSALLTVTNVN